MKAYGGMEVQLHPFLIPALDAYEWSALQSATLPLETILGRLGGPHRWSECFAEEKIFCPFQELNDNSLVVQPIAYSLYWLHYPGSFQNIILNLMQMLMYSEGPYFLYIQVFSHNCVPQWHVIFIYIQLPEIYTWCCYCGGKKSRHTWENNIEWTVGNTYSWSVRFCSSCEGKIINAWSGIWSIPLAFQIQPIQSSEGEVSVQKQIHCCSWGILRSLNRSLYWHSGNWITPLWIISHSVVGIK